MSDNINDLVDEVNSCSEKKIKYKKSEKVAIFFTALFSVISILALVFSLYILWPKGNVNSADNIPQMIDKKYFEENIIKKISNRNDNEFLKNIAYEQSDDYLNLKTTLTADQKNRLLFILNEIGFFNVTEQQYILIVLICGALGSLVFGLKSLGRHLGLMDFRPSWLASYYIKPFLGGSLALIFYFIIRGGILVGNVSTDKINIFGIAAISGLIGMFTEQAIYKLKEIFDNLFAKEQNEIKAKPPLELPEEIIFDDQPYSKSKFDALIDEDKKYFHGCYRDENGVYKLNNNTIDQNTKLIILSIINKMKA